MRRDKVNSPKRNTLKELEQRKRRIEAELNQIENSFEGSIKKVGQNLARSIIPVDSIRRKPFKAIGVSLLTGFAIGLTGFRKRKKNRSKDASGSGNDGVAGMVFDELKRISARRAVQYVVDQLDERLKSRASTKDSAEKRPEDGRSA